MLAHRSRLSRDKKQVRHLVRIIRQSRVVRMPSDKLTKFGKHATQTT